MDRCTGSTHVFVEPSGLGSAPTCLCGMRKNGFATGGKRSRMWIPITMLVVSTLYVGLRIATGTFTLLPKRWQGSWGKGE